MKIDIITLFPGMFAGPLDESIIKRAKDEQKVDIKIHDLRQFGIDKRKTVDDRPYGGGTGMILMVKPLFDAISSIKTKDAKVILLTPRGKKYNQDMAVDMSKYNHLILICGHYEGYDERITEFVDEELSVGDFILTGGEIPAMAVVDSIVRLIPGVLKKQDATINESFSQEGIVEYPQYTRPEEFKGHKVPKILLQGNHKEIEKYRQEESQKRSQELKNKKY